MKSMKTNGQVLSEKEMKEVKGGQKYKVSDILIENGKVNYCMFCGHKFESEELEPDDKGYIVCSKCGGRTSVEE